jgi:hypothetical protein
MFIFIGVYGVYGVYGLLGQFVFRDGGFNFYMLSRWERLVRIARVAV